ncbi:MAG: hypothetical protein AAB328_07170, partial [candidate division NC10 bacterium]
MADPEPGDLEVLPEPIGNAGLDGLPLGATGGPDSYTLNRSITVLCFLIIGGMGNIKGALLGTFVLMGYDNIL